MDGWDGSARWLRCALHAHTTGSDGELSAGALCRHYARAGYDVLAITDHWRCSEPEDDAGLLVLPGVELNCMLPGGRDGHVLGFGVEAAPEELAALGAEYADLERTGEWVVEHGGVAYLAHPYWTGVTPGTLELPDSVAGVEVFNAGCELEVGRGLSSVHWDELLEAGRRCHAIATDDSHHPGFDSDFAWTWLRVEECTTAAVLGALAAGELYASTGPRIEALRVEEGTVEVRCDPCRSVTLLTGRTRGAAVHAGRLGYRHGGDVLETAGGGVVRARLVAPEPALYGRLELVDLDGRKAWSNVLW